MQTECSRIRIIKDKILQARKVMRKENIDCWITFVRDSQIMCDPVLPFLISGHLTWPSAIIIPSHGKTQVIVGLYDKDMIVESGVFDDVVGYVQDFNAPLR